MFIGIWRKVILYNSEIEIMFKLHKYDIEKSLHNTVMRAFIYEKLIQRK